MLSIIALHFGCSSEIEQITHLHLKNPDFLLCCNSSSGKKKTFGKMKLINNSCEEILAAYETD